MTLFVDKLLNLTLVELFKTISPGSTEKRFFIFFACLTLIQLRYFHNFLDCNEFDDSESSEDDEVEGQGSGVQGEASNSEVDDLPRFLWKPPDIKQPMAEWEKHTKVK